MAALSIGLLAALPAASQPVQPERPSLVTAVDILLKPDATMTQHAEAANERLLATLPTGFALDETHRPHVTCLQRYVRTADLEKVYEAIRNVLATERPSTWKLRAYRYFYVPWNDLGLAGIAVEPTDDLVRYQKKLIDAVAAYTAKTGTAAAFVTTKEHPDIDRPTIDYVASYVPDQIGERFHPHVTIGLAPPEYLKKMLDERFEVFTFSPVGAAIYQLGDFGTARKELKSWKLEP